MNQDKYNGWTNRATWLINLWYEPNTISDLDWIKDELEERASDLANSENVCDKILSDMLDLQAINWDELKEHVETEETCEEDDEEDDADIEARAMEERAWRENNANHTTNN